MPSPTSFTGTVASRGYAEGPLFPLGGSTATYKSSGGSETEAGRLRAALGASSRQLAALMEQSGGEAADILEFQLAMLEDDALSESAFAVIAGGTDAVAAWSAALDAQIEAYESAEDDYFRARAADLRDIKARVIANLSGDVGGAPEPGAVLIGDDITPSQFLAADWGQGGAIVLRAGSAASHVAMLARAKGVPMLVGVASLTARTGTALVDAEAGTVTLGADPAMLAAFAATAEAARLALSSAGSALASPARTADGCAISVNVNIASPGDVDSIDIATCDGVGLMRTEFLYGQHLPDEESQLEAYRRVVRWAAGKPVVIRAVDAGGDKPVPGFTQAETNPFLGLRGIRLALARPDVFRVQIRALLRVAAEGDVRVMLPMVTIADEYRAARALFAEEAAKLAEVHVSHVMPPLGIMVEVPAVAIAPGLLAEAAFFSIGSNDLTQYVMAAGRDNGSVAALNDVTHPAVLSLIENVVRLGAARNIPVSLCGDAGSDPAAIPALLRAGLRSLSVAPAQLARARLAISATAL